MPTGWPVGHCKPWLSLGIFLVSEHFCGFCIPMSAHIGFVAAEYNLCDRRKHFGFSRRPAIPANMAFRGWLVPVVPVVPAVPVALCLL